MSPRGTRLGPILAIILSTGCGPDSPVEEQSTANGTLYAVSCGDRWGYVDADGEVVIDIKYEDARAFGEGLAPIKQAGFWGFVDVGGREIIKPSFDEALAFSDGLARVKKGDGWGFIDKRGEFVVYPSCSSIAPFSNGLAMVTDSNKSYYINRDGAAAFNTGYRAWGSSFVNGLVAVSDGRRVGVMDTLGQVVIPPTFGHIGSFHEGLAAAIKGEVWAQKWGFINVSGEMVGDCQYDMVRGFKEGRAEVQKNGLWGYIDRYGNQVTDTVFDDVRPFTEGLAGVKQGHSWGYIDKDGEVRIGFRFEAAGQFQAGYAGAKSAGKWGVIDTAGDWVVTPTYDQQFCQYGQGEECVRTAFLGDDLFLLRYNGEIIWDPSKCR